MELTDILQLPEPTKQELAGQAESKGDEFLQKGELRSAEGCFLFALQLSPTRISVLLKLANLCIRNGRLLQAIQIYKQVLSLEPDNFSALASSLQILLKTKKYRQAKKYIDKLAINHPKAFYLILWKYEWAEYTCNWPVKAELAKILDNHNQQALNKDTQLLEPPLAITCRSMNLSMLLAIEKKLAEQIKKEVTPINFQPFTYPYRHQKIHLGYVTDDLQDHPVAHLINQLFRYHDKSKFKVFVYSHYDDDGNPYLQTVKDHADQFSVITRCSALEAANQIHQDEIDILIDLKGHTMLNRLDIFALRPAPIQITFLGFPGGTGASYMDYIIADKIVIPKEDYPYYTEKIITLPCCYQPNGKDRVVANTVYTRENLGLPKDKIILGSFNTIYKVEKEFIDAIIAVLKATDNTVLWLAPENRYAKHHIAHYLKENGIPKERFVFARKLPKPEHLARIRLVDLMLDTFTCNGHTSTSDALWMGVPVVTCQGKHFASRVSSSILTSFEMPELITYSIDEFIQKIILFCKDETKINALKKKAWEKREKSELFDIEHYCKVF